MIGQKTADLTSWRLFDTDAAILRRTGSENIAAIFDQPCGESNFRRMEEECIREIQTMGEQIIVATGGGLPAIDGLMPKLNSLGLTVYLKASVDMLWTRLSMDPKRLADRPLLREGGHQVLQEMLVLRESIYSQAAVVLDTEQLSVDEVCAILKTQVSSMDSGRALEHGLN